MDLLPIFLLNIECNLRLMFAFLGSGASVPTLVCSVDLTTKPEECQCRQEIDHCEEMMEKFGDPKQCITLHPGFQDVCPNRHVMEIAVLGLKTQSGKSYKTMFLQGQNQSKLTCLSHNN